MKAWFYSVWDDGVEIGTRCDVNEYSHEVFPEEVEVSGLMNLVREYVVVDGKAYPVRQADYVEFCNGTLVDTDVYWYE